MATQEDTSVAPTDAPAEDSESPKPSLPHKKSLIHSSKSETRLNREMVEMKYKQLGLKMDQDAEAARVRTALRKTLLQLTKDEIQLLTTTQFYRSPTDPLSITFLQLYNSQKEHIRLAVEADLEVAVAKYFQEHATIEEGAVKQVLDEAKRALAEVQRTVAESTSSGAPSRRKAPDLRRTALTRLAAPPPPPTDKAARP